jgi:PEP-CTERM motif-containing protein
MKNASGAIRFSLCAIKLLLFACAFSCLVAMNGAYAQNHATADISGVCCQGEVHIDGGQNFGPLSATDQYNSDNDTSLGSFRSDFLVTGNASVNADQGHNVINLRTQVTAQRRADTSSAVLTAETFWVDHITLSNPQNLIFPADGFIGFFGTVSGNLSGQSSVSYQIQVASGPDYSDFVEFSANTPGSYTTDLDPGTFSAGAHISTVMTYGLDLTLHLTVSAADTPSGSADFGSTGKFLGFTVVDANGNPVPNADELVFTGDSGFIYPVVQPVPEPAAALLLIFGAGLLALRYPKKA